MALRVLLLAVCLAPSSLLAQAEFRIYTDSPRIFLREDRLRRLQRDVERETSRWRGLADRLAQPGSLSEEPFALALAYQARGDQALGRKAVEWALAKAGAAWTEPNDLRQAAIVFDWCGNLLSEAEKSRLISSLARAAGDASHLAGTELGWVRAGLMTSIALGGEWEGSEEAIGRFLNGQWRSDIAPALLEGKLVDDAEKLVTLLEIAIAWRDNLESDLWKDAPRAFQSLPPSRLLSYYKPAIDSPEGLVRPPTILPPSADPVRQAMFGRIAEMMLVAYDNSAPSAQFLQGWLRNDRFTLRGPYGAPYELLWLNRYLPGLSPNSAPPVAYDELRGRVFGRQGWDEGDLWIGYWDNRFHLLADGELVAVSSADKQAPLIFSGRAVVLPGEKYKTSLTVPIAVPPYGTSILLLGLDEDREYEVKTNRSKRRTYTPGPGGVIEVRNDAAVGTPEIDFEKKVRLEVRAGDKVERGGFRPTLGASK